MLEYQDTSFVPAPQPNLSVVVERALSLQFPKAFTRSKRQPLKVGIHIDIIERWPEIDVVALSHAMRRYTSNIGYLYSLKKRSPRVDLDGSPSGIVTEVQAAWAKELRRRIWARMNAKSAEKLAA